MKIKVLHIIPNLGTGGAEKLLLDLLSNYDKSKFEMAVLSLYDKSHTIYEDQLEKIGIEVFHLGKKPGIDISMIRKILRVFKAYSPDVIHTHLYVVKYTLIPSIIKRIPVKIHTVHNIAEKELNSIGIKVQHIAYKYFKYKPVSISSSISKSIQKLYRLKSDIPLINNGIDIDKYYIKKSDPESKIINLIHVGRFSPQKNHNMLIDAFNLIVKERSDVRLTLVGDGELREVIEKKVQHLGISDYVDFLGVRKDIPNLLSNSDVFLMSSEWEGLPLTLLEAMASGLPIVATNVGGIPDVVEEEINAILVPNKDHKVFYQAIKTVTDDYNMRKSMGEKSYELSRGFDIRLTEKKYEELYLANYTEKHLKGKRLS